MLEYICTQLQGSVDKQENAIEAQQKVTPESAQNMFKSINSFIDCVQSITGYNINVDIRNLKAYVYKYVPAQQEANKLDKGDEIKIISYQEQTGSDISEHFQGITVSHENETKSQKSQLLDERISQEIHQIPTTLATNFSPEQIKHSISIYKGTLESFSEEEIAGLKDINDSQERYQVLLEFFIEDGIPPDVADILSKIDYNGHLFDILGDENKRKDFFEQLEQVIEGPEQHPIQDEHVQEAINRGNIKEETLDAAAAIETQQEHITGKKQTATQEQQPKAEQSDFSKIVASEFGSEEHVHPEESSKVDDMEQENSELHNQNTALVQQDNSFIGKIRRVVANMRDNKNKSNKGFFGRLKDSIQSEFGNKKESQYFMQEDTEQQSNSPMESATVQQNSQQQQVNDVFQRVSVNPLEAVRKTAESNAKKSLETDDKAQKDEGEREN